MKNKYITNDEQTVIKELSDLRGHLDIAIDQLKNGQGCVLTKNWLMANILMLLGMEEINKVYNDNGEIIINESKSIVNITNANIKVNTISIFKILNKKSSKKDIPVVRIHTASATALKTVLEQYCR